MFWFAFFGLNSNAQQSVVTKHVKDPSTSLIQQMNILLNPALQCSGSISKNSWKTRFDILDSDII